VGVILIELLLESNIFRKSMLLYYRSLSILRVNAGTATVADGKIEGEIPA